MKRIPTIHVLDAILIAMMPNLIAILNPHFFHEHLLFLYVIIAFYMMYHKIERQHHRKYGQLIYRRTMRTCEFKCWLSQIVLLMALFHLGLLFNWSLEIICLLASMIQLIYIKQHLSIVLYTKGMMYKGRFYNLHDIRSGHLVKNYRSMYEIHMEKKMLVLDANELALTQRKS